MRLTNGETYFGMTFWWSMAGVDPVPKFPLGKLVATSGALGSLDQASIFSALARHSTGDWGEMDADDRKVNDHALRFAGRLVSVYTALNKERFYIITEADRSRTTVLLPDEY